MAHSDLIDSLIGTYRTLNLTIRPISNEQAAVPGPGGRTLLEVVAEMRASELVTSQKLKNMTFTDVRAASGQLGEIAVPEPLDDQNLRYLLSEFGTAREAILALVRSMPDDQLDMERTTPEGTTTIRAVIDGLVERDQALLKEINALVPAAAS